MASATAFGNGNTGFQARTINGSVQTSFYLPPGKSREDLRLVGSSEQALTMVPLQYDERHHFAHRF